MDLKIKLIQKDMPTDVPGTWEDSKLTFKAVGLRSKINMIAEAIRKAISEMDE